MVRVKYRDLNGPDKLQGKLKLIFKTRLFKIAFALFLIGLVMVVASFQIHGTYYYQNNTSENLILNDSTAQIFNFSMLPGAPLNLTFTAPTGNSIHYSVYTIAYVIKNGVNVELKTLVLAGTATNNSIQQMASIYTQNYYVMELTTNTTNSFHATVSANQAIPKEIPSNFYFGVPGATILVIGAIGLAISITRGFK